MRDGHSSWPALPLAAWKDTYATLHMYTQIIGKLRLALCTPENQFWHVPFYLTVRGLTTSPMPYGDRTISDRLRLHRSRARRARLGRAHAHAAARAAPGRRVLPGGARAPGRARRRRAHLGAPCRGPRSGPVRRRHAPPKLRPGRGAHLLRGPAARRRWRSSSTAVASPASRARCTSSGAASTWRSRASRGGRRRRGPTPIASRACRTTRRS